MTSPATLDIKVVYSASARPRGKRKKRIGSAPRLPGRTGLLWGTISLIVACSLSYGTWWQVDKKLIYTVFLMKTPVPGVDLDQAAAMFMPRTAATPEPAPPPPDEQETVAAPKYGGQTAAVIIFSSGYAWLTLSTVASCIVALSAGAAFARAGGTALRRIGMILALAGIIGLGFAVYMTFNKYGTGYPPSHLRVGMNSLIVLAMFIGLANGRRAGGVARAAAFALFVAAAGTSTGLYLGGQCGAISPERSSLAFLAGAFVVHSLYGWILLPVAKRLGR